MISVVIPTLNAESVLAPALAALVPAAVSGMVREVIISDGGSTDATAVIADAAGAMFLTGGGGRGVQFRAGADAAKSKWLLFLHADTVLDPEWERDALCFIRDIEKGVLPDQAAYFRFALDDRGFMPRALETLVALRCAVFRLPYGDQGLLISRRLYDSIGGFKPMPLMEDVDIVRRLGRRRLTGLNSRATTSAARYRKDGYLPRMLRNLSCLTLYYLNVSPARIARLYERRDGGGGPRTSV
jgi:rSAM/selenodomain-associated transferase 2